MDVKNVSSIEPKGRHSASNITDMSEVMAFTPQELDDLKIVHVAKEGSKQIKIFRDLRTRLMERSNGNNFVCLVTSAASGGSSYVATNLAATIAFDRTKTSMLVDCNLYSPSAERLLPVSPQSGLTDYLDDLSMGVEDIVYASGLPRVRVVPVGNNREGGTEKINSNRMRDFFEEAKTRYHDRFTLVDSPSAAEYDAEIRILADLCDFVLLVVPYGKVTPAQVNAAINKIGAERLVGVVYNEG